MIIKEITLLDAFTYQHYIDYIPKVNGCWWLRSYGESIASMQCVFYNGLINEAGAYVCNSGSVRPALLVDELNVLPGNKIILFDYSWTVLNKHLVLCDSIIGHHKFNNEFNRFVDSLEFFLHSSLCHFLNDWLIWQKNKSTKIVHIQNKTELLFLQSFCKKHDFNIPIISDFQHSNNFYLVFCPCDEWKKASDLSTIEKTALTFSEFCECVTEELNNALIPF